MLNKEKLEQLMGILGDLTDEQKAIVAETLNGPINEKELFEKLGVDEGKFTEFLTALAAEQEDAVLGQELSPDEMDVAGGLRGAMSVTLPASDCISYSSRNIYDGGFPNCAATVEDGSWCGSNDACYSKGIKYVDMKDCGKAWR